MALSKEVEHQNGVVFKYHRIVSLNIITNHANVIEVCSYTSEEKRREEEKYDPYTSTAYFEAPYDQEMTIATAYEWVKANTDALSGAFDVL